MSDFHFLGDWSRSALVASIAIFAIGVFLRLLASKLGILRTDFAAGLRAGDAGAQRWLIGIIALPWLSLAAATFQLVAIMFSGKNLRQEDCSYSLF